MASSKEPSQTFESAMERLESIVEAMESDKLPLEDLLKRYEEGTRLVKLCQEKLESAEKRIELITKGAAGKAELTPFDPKPTGRESAKPAPPSDDEETSLF
jgi:exodeoxyribonuclease VII small subunit